MIALLILTNDPKVMGAFVNGRMLKVMAVAATVLVLGLNVLLLLSTLGIELPLSAG